MADMRAPDRCEQCGQVDDHPKVHNLNLLTGAIVTKHHDCLSADEEQQQRDSAQPEGWGPKISAVIDACKSGIKGQQLAELIQSDELPRAEGLHYKRLAEQEAAE